MTLDEYCTYDALGLARLIASKQISEQQLLHTAVAALEALNPALNALTQTYFDHAAAAIDRGLPNGMFRGVPFLLKDAGIQLKGTPAYHGSRWFEDWPAAHDSTLTERYKQSGLVILGKTNAPEFGLSVTTEPLRFGATRNPWNLDKSPGGSSGGAAAAVASGMTPIAHATDGGGSIRIPASCCGLFGLKPSRGRVPNGPDRGEAWHGLAIAHALTRSVRDSAALLDAIGGPEPGDSYYCKPVAQPFLATLEESPRPLRIGFSTKASVPVHIECKKAVELTARLCADLGHQVEETEPPVDCDELNEPFLAIAAASTAAAISGASRMYDKPFGPDDFEPVGWTMIERGLTRPMYELSLAIDAAQRASRRAASFHERYDLFLCPTLAMPPQPLNSLTMSKQDVAEENNRSYEFSPFTAVANMTGQPSANLPLMWTESGLPIGIMLTAAYGEETLLFQISRQLETACPWAHRYPAPAAQSREMANE